MVDMENIPVAGYDRLELLQIADAVAREACNASNAAMLLSEPLSANDDSPASAAAAELSPALGAVIVITGGCVVPRMSPAAAGASSILANLQSIAHVHIHSG